MNNKTHVQIPCFVGVDGADGFFVCVPRAWKKDLVGAGFYRDRNEAVIEFRNHGTFAFSKGGKGRKMVELPAGVDITTEWSHPWGSRDLLNHLRFGIYVQSEVYLDQMG